MKFEIRNSKFETNSNIEFLNPVIDQISFRASGFGIASNFDLQISNFAGRQFTHQFTLS